MTVDGGQKAVDGGKKPVNGEQKTVDGKPKTLRKFRLEDLTKAELIKLIRQRAVTGFSQHDIAMKIWERLCERGSSLYTQGLALMEKAKGISDWQEHMRVYQLGSKIFDEGARVHDRADRFFRQYVVRE